MNLKNYRHYRKFLAAKYCRAKFMSDILRRLRLSGLSVKLNQYFFSGIQKFLKDNYLSVIQQAEKDTAPAAEKSEYDDCIWIAWFQGLEKAPPLVQHCVKSIQQNANGHKVIIITEKNIFDFVQFPDYIIQKYKAKILTMQQLSNMLRMSLIYKYGGVWIDATMLATAPLSPAIFNSEFYTIKKTSASPYYIPQGRWTTYFLSGKKGCPLAHIIVSVLFAYWKTNTELVDYFLFDQTINFCYENSPMCHALIESVPENNPEAIFFKGRYGKPFDAAEWERIKKTTSLFKLSWKEPFDSTKKGTWYTETIETV